MMKRTVTVFKGIDAITILLTLSAGLLAGLRIWHHVSGQSATAIDDWRGFAAGGHRIGSAGATVVIVEFSDFQCVHCRSAYHDLKAIRHEYQDEITIVYRHLPSTGSHEHSLEAALAAECAAEQGRFTALHDVLFEQQELIGSKAWSDFAAEARVESVGQFDMCMAERRGMDAIRSDFLAGQSLGLQGTPSFLINGFLVQGYPGTDRLRTLIIETRSSQSRTPVDGETGE